MIWMIIAVIYFTIGIILAFTMPYNRDVPLVDNIMVAVGWLPIIIILSIIVLRGKFKVM